MTFDVAGGTTMQLSNGSELGSLVALCRHCKLGIAILAAPDYHAFSRNGLTFERFAQFGDDLSDTIEIKKIWPEPPEIIVPKHLPDSIARIFGEAEKNRLNDSRESAGIMYRKALDVGSKLIDSKIIDGNLASRLRKLAAAGKLTVDIADWAAAIREAGNEATHEEEAPSDEEINELANLTRMVLVYLFEMPGRVRLMREHKEGAGAIAD